VEEVGGTPEGTREDGFTGVHRSCSVQSRAAQRIFDDFECCLCCFVLLKCVLLCFIIPIMGNRYGEREASKREFFNNTKSRFFSLRLACLEIQGNLESFGEQSHCSVEGGCSCHKILTG